MSELSGFGIGESDLHVGQAYVVTGAVMRAPLQVAVLGSGQAWTLEAINEQPLKARAGAGATLAGQAGIALDLPAVEKELILVG